MTYYRIKLEQEDGRVATVEKEFPDEIRAEISLREAGYVEAGERVGILENQKWEKILVGEKIIATIERKHRTDLDDAENRLMMTTLEEMGGIPRPSDIPKGWQSQTEGLPTIYGDKE